MGTDGVGRDVFARFLAGGRISLVVALATVVIGGTIGCGVGLMAGLLGRWADNAAMRGMDVLLAFPPLILAMAVVLALGPGLQNAILAITLTFIPFVARIVRSQVLRIRSQTFIDASISLGSRRHGVVRRHLLPHVFPTVVVAMASSVGFAILSLAALGYLGLGVQSPTPEWGTAITEGLPFALSGQWWISVFPGLGVVFAVTIATVGAEKMRDRLDPQGPGPRAGLGKW
jgi:peptide/nickel transport system permease protein